MCFLPLPFDPRRVFGKVRAPVVVRLKGHAYRSTIASMGDGPMSYSHRREHVEAIEGAVKPETRARRVAAAVAMVAAR